MCGWVRGSEGARRSPLGRPPRGECAWGLGQRAVWGQQVGRGVWASSSAGPPTTQDPAGGWTPRETRTGLGGVSGARTWGRCLQRGSVAGRPGGERRRGVRGLPPPPGPSATVASRLSQNLPRASRPVFVSLQNGIKITRKALLLRSLCVPGPEGRTLMTKAPKTTEAPAACQAAGQSRPATRAEDTARLWGQRPGLRPHLAQ